MIMKSKNSKAQIIRVKTSFVLNPFFWLIIIWFFIPCLYLFNICSIYPSLDLRFMAFLLIINILNLFFYYIFKIKILKNKKFILSISSSPCYLLSFICILSFIIEIVYSKSLPLIGTLLGDGSSYRDFGIPSLTFLFVSLRLALVALASVKLVYSKNDKLKNLVTLLVPYLIFIFTYTRGILIFSFIITFIILLSKYKLTFKILFLGFFLILIGMLFFNIAGNIRQESNWRDSTYLLNISGFNYKGTILEYFSWTLVYLVSPIGNLNYNIVHNLSQPDILGFFSQLIPDVIGKRIAPNFDSTLYLTQPGLNVSSMYSGAFKYGGFLGMFISYFELVAFFFAAAYLTKNNTKYFLAIVSSLSAMAIITFFTNPVSYTGYSFFAYILLLLKFFEGRDKYKLKFYTRKPSLYQSQ